MKRVFYVILSLVTVINLFAVYSFAGERDTGEHIKILGY